MGEEKYREYKIYGLVQGVGFRPFVARVADDLSLCGDVRNDGGIVTVRISATDDTAEEFLRRIYACDLPGARIDSIDEIYGDVSYRYSDNDINHENISFGKDEHIKDDRFVIIESSLSDDRMRVLPPDAATCPKCEKELYDPANRRYRHPFISCVSCGPRYSILEDIPYDRENISMRVFALCPDCDDEYKRRGDRREYAQTICCHTCGPKLYGSVKNSVLISSAHKGSSSDDFSGGGEDPLCADTASHRNVSAKSSDAFSSGEDCIREAVNVIKSGGIVAVKDIGGYHFACDALNEEAVSRLRNFKHRDAKPFAVMFRTIDEIGRYADISATEADLLTSPVRPIVLLDKIASAAHTIPDCVLGASNRIGAMLPCNPLQMLISDEASPLVMTSGNRGGEPICIDDDVMRSYLDEGIDYVLSHDRRIVCGLDDSIYQVIRIPQAEVAQDMCAVPRDGDMPDKCDAPRDGDMPDMRAVPRDGDMPDKCDAPRDGDMPDKCAASHKGDILGARWNASHISKNTSSIEIVQILRRARGLVPLPIDIGRKLPADTFAAGGDLKAVFALGRDNYAYLSGHFGDLDDVRAQDARLGEIERMSKLLNIYPLRSVTDKHPAYHTVQNHVNDNPAQVQHHVAHIASVMAEHHLTEPLLGLAFDGTGYGEDGSIWGGEFLYWDGNEFGRVGHLGTVRLVGSDESAKNAAHTAYLYACEAKSRGLLDDTFCEALYISDSAGVGKDKADHLRIAWEKKINTYNTSSMGRLFDAISSLLGICHYNSYEGECAMRLQAAAETVELAVNDIEISDFVQRDEAGSLVIDGVRIFSCIAELKKIGANSAEELAMLFHYLLALSCVRMCEMITEKKRVPIALSGGTMQNALFLKLLISSLAEKGFSVYLNEQVPCGDGGLALGQLYLRTF